MSIQHIRRDNPSRSTSNPLATMKSFVKTANHKIWTKVKASSSKFHCFTDLPAELQDLIIELAIPAFQAKVKISHKGRCQSAAENRPVRWKVTHIPQIALNLQLVDRDVRLKAKRHLLKKCKAITTYGLPTDCICPADTVRLLLVKHTHPAYLLYNAVMKAPRPSDIRSANMWLLYKMVNIKVSLKQWKDRLHVNDDLYLSKYTSDWHVESVTAEVIPLVLERLLPVMVILGQPFSIDRHYRNRVVLLTELRIIFAASKRIKVDLSRVPPVLVQFVSRKQLEPEKTCTDSGLVKRALFKLKHL